ncbi:hypothetical protein [Streptomyces anulatus]|uniref:hypothetical protein n=1 Tax=Streptomyces anulatus TaxID=1892 RepID=UPI002E1236D0|nr:hypothetical protein OG557_38720 [Streptomyces anulatus]
MVEQVYKARSWRYFEEDEQEFDTQGEALGFLASSWAASDCSPISVVGPDGQVILSGDALQAEIMKYLEAN